MAIKKLTASSKAMDYPSSDPCSGNNKWGVGTKSVNWPMQVSSYDDETAPQQSTAFPQQLSGNQNPYQDHSGNVPIKKNYKSTLG